MRLSALGMWRLCRHRCWCWLWACWQPCWLAVSSVVRSGRLGSASAIKERVTGMLRQAWILQPFTQRNHLRLAC